jgi:magnesium chelatase subunit I
VNATQGNDALYPFVAIVGQERMKKALILTVVNPGLSGVLIRGEKGTSKSTAVRGLAAILPEIDVQENDPYRRAPGEAIGASERTEEEEQPRRLTRDKVRVVELPIGATEDRVVGTMNLEHALKHGERRFEPGLLAAAHRGILYVDEVNLLDDHIVDVLLDSAAMGVNTVEREGVSFSHPARFTLVGTMNPEEGELRPQFLDRFGLCVSIRGIEDPAQRVEVMERRAAYEADPAAFCEKWVLASSDLGRRIADAMSLLPRVKAERELLFEIARRCLELGVDGHRGDIVTLKAAKTIAALEGRLQVQSEDIAAAAELTLPHRVRRQPFQDIVEVLRAINRPPA